MTAFPLRPFRAVLILTLGTVSGACWLVHRVVISDVQKTSDSVRVATPVKAHLIDGHTLLYQRGVTVAHNALLGEGTRYDLRLQPVGEVSSFPLDSVLGMESFKTVLDGGATVAFSTLTVVGLAGLSVAIACAVDPKCFGSCPTFYADSAGTEVLEAEGFSYSIAPLFEARDVDRLRGWTRPDGSLQLEVRNEAYETHYLNQLELLEVTRGAGETVVSDPGGRPLAVQDLGRPSFARDRTGRDLRATLAAADGDALRTDPRTLAAARIGDLLDTIELAFPAPGNADSVALVFRMRNSLLNTVLLYDLMLGDAGARSLDWQAEELERVGPALQLGQWYATHLGMQIEVWSEGAWRQVARVRDTGPVAWKDIGVVVPGSADGMVRVRLTYVADNWRIDRIALGSGFRRLGGRAWPLSRVLDASGAEDTASLASLVAADRRYLQTSAGQRFTAVWQPGADRTDSLRTFFLVSQGYYVEWIRRGWLAEPRRRTSFIPSDSALAEAVARYRVVKDTLEQRFAATRVPVR